MKHTTSTNTQQNSTAPDTELPSFNPEQEEILADLMPQLSPEEQQKAEERDSLLRGINDMSDEELLLLCKPRLCASCPVAKEAEDNHLRSLAEIDNARKRMAREKEEFIRFAAEGVLADIVPCIDNLELALQHSAKEEACKSIVIGVDMTKKLLLESLKKHGLEQVGQIGEPFDPTIHEAVGIEDIEGIEPDCVGKILASGYKLHNRLLRPAQVLVCKR